MIECDYVLSIDNHAAIINGVIGDFVAEAMNQTGYCTLQHQLRLYQTQFEGTVFATQDSLGTSYAIDSNPRMEYFKTDPKLGSLALKDMPGKDINTPSAL